MATETTQIEFEVGEMLDNWGDWKKKVTFKLDEDQNKKVEEVEEKKSEVQKEAGEKKEEKRMERKRKRKINEKKRTNEELYRVKKGQIIGNRYVIKSRLARFSKIYFAERLQSSSVYQQKPSSYQQNEQQQQVAVKLELVGRTQRLVAEKAFYNAVAKSNNKDQFIKVYELYHFYLFRALIMEKTGPSLWQLFDRYKSSMTNGHKHVFSIDTVLMFGAAALKILKTVHETGFVHRDIRLANFVVSADNASRLYLVDFDLSVKYVDANGEHLPDDWVQRPDGNYEMMSPNVHAGSRNSRRDDLVSLAYSMILLFCGSLPWIKTIREAKRDDKTSRKKMLDQVKLMKKEYTGLIVSQNNQELWLVGQFLEYCRELSYDQEPNYDMWIGKFEESVDWPGQAKFDWDGRQLGLEIREISE